MSKPAKVVSYTLVFLLTILFVLILGGMPRNEAEANADAADNAGTTAHERYMAKVMHVHHPGLMLVWAAEKEATRKGTSFKEEADAYGRLADYGKRMATEYDGK
jgi:hypothetical protein